MFFYKLKKMMISWLLFFSHQQVQIFEEWYECKWKSSLTNKWILEQTMNILFQTAHMGKS